MPMDQQGKMARNLWQSVQWLACSLFICLQVGCWAPLRAPGVLATELPDIYRMPMRTSGEPLNFASLTIKPPKDYILGPNDQLEVTIAGLNKDGEIHPISVRIMADGTIHLPLVGAIKIGDKNLIDAQRSIIDAYATGYLKNPQVNLTLVQKEITSVLVLGEVNQPGVHILPKYENDVGHALAAAGGLADDAAHEIEVHRRKIETDTASCQRLPGLNTIEPDLGVEFTPQANWNRQAAPPEESQTILKIPLRTGSDFALSDVDITLDDGDVIVVPSRKHEVFYVVGKLSTTNTVRFTIGDRERELGVGFVLPRDREIDVVTAVVMAGYIDPIDSPTTVTVHRVRPDGKPMLILVDLIEARCNPRATVLVEPGDIIYLNPDARWYMRRTIDRIFPDILLNPYSFWTRRSILGRGDL